MTLKIKYRVTCFILKKKRLFVCIFNDKIWNISNRSESVRSLKFLNITKASIAFEVLNVIGWRLEGLNFESK